jgi:hypothetical protein
MKHQSLKLHTDSSLSFSVASSVELQDCYTESLWSEVISKDLYGNFFLEGVGGGME